MVNLAKLQCPCLPAQVGEATSHPCEAWTCLACSTITQFRKCRTRGSCT